MSVANWWSDTYRKCLWTAGRNTFRPTTAEER